MFHAGVIASQVLAAAANPVPSIAATGASAALDPVGELRLVPPASCPLDQSGIGTIVSTCEPRHVVSAFSYSPTLSGVLVDWDDQQYEFLPANLLVVSHFVNALGSASVYEHAVRGLANKKIEARSGRVIEIIDPILRAIEAATPELAAAAADVRLFARCIPLDLAFPKVTTDGASEIVLSWRVNNSRAVLSFEGDGGFGYALLKHNHYVPGQEEGRASGPFPGDLLTYINESLRLP